MHGARFILLSAAFVLFFFSACAPDSAPKKSYGRVYLTSSVSFELLSPEYIEKSIDMFQRIDGAYGKNQFGVNAWVKADKAGMVMELFNDLGTSLGTLVYDSGELSFTSSYFPKNVKAEYAAADFQLCFYREEALRPALGALTLVRETETGGTEKRFVYDGDICVIEIEKNARLVRYTNYARDYRYTIQGEFL